MHTDTARASTNTVVGAIIRTCIGIIIGLLALPWCLDLVIAAGRKIPTAPPDPVATALGAAVGVIVILLRGPSGLLHTFIHELCHFLCCIVLGVRVESFLVTRRKGGAVEYRETDAFRRTIIALAPYTLPLVLGPLLLVRWLVPLGEGRPIMSGIVAAAYLFHLAGLFINIRNNFLPPEGDLAMSGRILGIIVIACVLMLVTAGTIGVLWSA